MRTLTVVVVSLLAGCSASDAPLDGDVSRIDASVEASAADADDAGLSSDAASPRAAVPIDDIEDYIISFFACVPNIFWAYIDGPIDTRFVERTMFDELADADYWVSYSDVPSVRACVHAAHGDCNAVMACLGYDPIRVVTHAECLATPSQCVDGVWTFCEYDRLVRHDLRVVGESCPTPPLSCSWTGWRCIDAHTAVQCDRGGVGFAYTCAPGDVCPVAACAPGATCPETRCPDTVPPCVSPRCDGDVLIQCVTSGPDRDEPDPARLGDREDCASGGMTCGLDAQGHAACLPTAQECVANEASCDGDVLTYCAPDGRIRRYDCVGHGFARCQAWTNVQHTNCAPATSTWP